MLEHIQVDLRSGGGGIDAAGIDWGGGLGDGASFDEGPCCRELGGRPVEAIVGSDPRFAGTPIRVEWVEALLELVGPDATVRLLGRNMEREPIEEISMRTFLERVGFGH